MRVAFDLRAARHGTGIARYATCLRGALSELDGVEVEDTHVPRPGRADVYHSPWLEGAPLRPALPTVVTLHDVIPLKRPGEYLRTGLRFRMRYLAVQRAERVIVPTRAVATEARSLLGLDEARVVVVGEAAADGFAPQPAAAIAAVRARFGLPERYLLAVGGLSTPDPRKRVTALTRVPRSLALVLVGEAGRWARELEGVILTGRVSDPELAALYSGAHAVVLPSDDEGFGLVPVEALACGAPVVAADTPAVREVLADRARLWPADDLTGLVAAAEAAQRPAPAPLPVRWSDVAAATVAVYADAIAAAAAGARRPR
ncbi:glycosyltransferase family 1 protein [Conexibacter sp. DBS9H8]|uniref:glycosyltransferase family 4 protein n=1 Tax=Conexibacter sp. DBS9H8 TaxID=2937801 RepID=UPI00200C5E7F|nr:glycosyltransferase family 1 protein [Conexibacter sp. DBS9H8]